MSGVKVEWKVYKSTTFYFPKMTLETITGSLLAYKELELGTFQHFDQLITERRSNKELRQRTFYTADGELYTIQGKKKLWAITREPQNLILQNIDDAHHQLITRGGHYFPDAEKAKLSLEHPDTVIIDINGLKLVTPQITLPGGIKIIQEDYSGYFAVDPRKVKKLNSQQMLAAQRIYGPDENNFQQNMDLFAQAGKKCLVWVLLPNYLQKTLDQNDKKYLELSSNLMDVYDFLTVNDIIHNFNDNYNLRGVCRIKLPTRNE